MTLLSLGQVISVFLAGGMLSGSAEPPTVAPPPQRLMAVTVDDLPVAQPSWHSAEEMEAITAKLLETLGRHRVRAVGFVNESKLEVDGKAAPARVELLERWLQAGHELGNHGFAHLDLHRVPVEEWLADVVRGERTTRPLVEAAGGRWRWFRHPYLHVGRSVAIQQESAAFLADRDYTVAPVTVDNSEWVYGRAYADAMAAGDRELMDRLGADYLRYMLAVVEFYEGQAEAIVGRPIPQVLLIHAYALNADHLDGLLADLDSRGYRWITLEEALADPVYRRPIEGYTGAGGITWLHRWAITEGLDRTIFAGEPEVPEWVRGEE